MTNSLPSHQLAAVRKLVARSPDKTLRVLLTALSHETGQDPLMAHVREIVTLERKFRGVREIVFGPLLVLFRPDTERNRPPLFAPEILNLVWAQVGDLEPRLVAEAISLSEDLKPQDYPPSPFDRLCKVAAQQLREDPSLFSPAKPELAEELAVYLDNIAPLRRAAFRLDDFVSKPSPENQAAFRVMVNEAVKIHPHAAPIMLKVLQANLREKSDVLKLMVLVSDRRLEGFHAESEFADFGVELLEVAEARLHDLTGIEARGSHALPDEARTLIGQIVRTCVTFEQSLEMTPAGVWGVRVADLRRRLIGFMEGVMRTLDRELDRVLPNAMVRVGKSHKLRPDLSVEVDPAVVATTVDHVRFVRDLKSSAASVGFLSAYNHYMAEIKPRIEYFGDMAVEDIKTGTHEVEHLRGLVRSCADLLEAAGEADLAQNLRRRGHSAKREEDPTRIKRI